MKIHPNLYDKMQTYVNVCKVNLIWPFNITRDHLRVGLFCVLRRSYNVTLKRIYFTGFVSFENIILKKTNTNQPVLRGAQNGVITLVELFRFMFSLLQVFWL